jgi:hypothetical protein
MLVKYRSWMQHIPKWVPIALMPARVGKDTSTFVEIKYAFRIH